MSCTFQLLTVKLECILHNNYSFSSHSFFSPEMIRWIVSDDDEIKWKQSTNSTAKLCEPLTCMTNAIRFENCTHMSTPYTKVWTFINIAREKERKRERRKKYMRYATITGTTRNISHTHRQARTHRRYTHRILTSPAHTTTGKLWRVKKRSIEQWASKKEARNKTTVNTHTQEEEDRGKKTRLYRS